MTDARVTAYEDYLAAWSPVPDEERLRLLHASVTEDVVFENPTRSRAGIADVADHLAAFQSARPGGSFRSLAMLGWEGNAMATWQLVGPDGKSGFSGYDVLAFDADHKISSILLFGNVDEQTLK